MPEIRGITVSVGEWYAATLAVTLPRNMRHLSECVVVSAPWDDVTPEVVRSVPGARLFVTDAFTRYGARFNKGLALEEGFDALGRDGWILIHDADVIFPDDIPWHLLRPDWLHGARRRVLRDPNEWSPALDWRTCPPSRDGGPIGFFQLFRADAIRDKRPWYDVSFAHAGGGDAYFMTHWPRQLWRTLPIECLHLGPTDTHWWGTSEESRAIMARFVRDNGWQRAAAQFPPDLADSAPPTPERIDVPGYEPTGFELPFVRRAREAARQS